MPKYVLHYFDIRARAEIIRLLLTAAGQDFEDHRVSGEDWPAFKQKLPTGQLPLLEMDGKKMSQSMAIARYLAREYGMGGKSNMEEFQVDQVVDQLLDLLNETFKPLFEKDEKKKEEMLKKLNEETFPKTMEVLSTYLDANGGEYFVGKGMTLADLYLYDVATHYVRKDENALKKYPKLAALMTKVAQAPKIRDYLAQRKDTDI